MATSVEQTRSWTTGARRKNHGGVLPGYTWLDKKGFIHSYDVVKGWITSQIPVF